MQEPSLTLDPRSTALLVIECQNGLIHERNLGKRGIGGALARAASERGLLARAARVLEAARAAGIRVLYLTMEGIPGFPRPDAPIYRKLGDSTLLEAGTWSAEVHPALAPQSGDLKISRHLSEDPSHGSSLWPSLHALRIETLVAFGVSTNFAVEGTVRAAVNRFHRVIVLEDCCASVPEEWHRFSTEKILPLIATVTSSEKLIAALRAGSPSE